MTSSLWPICICNYNVTYQLLFLLRPQRIWRLKNVYCLIHVYRQYSCFVAPILFVHWAVRKFLIYPYIKR